jgi:DNA end-binding protein Ku
MPLKQSGWSDKVAQTVWRGHLTFGLVSFPVRLYKAARPEKIPLRRLYRPASPPPAPEPPPPTTLKASRTVAPPVPEELPEPPVFRTQNRIVAPAAEPDVDLGEPPPSEIVKGFEYDEGRYVVLEDEELKAITPQTSKEMQIVEFVRLPEIDPIYFETSYYVHPEEAGQRPYALLFEALKESAFVGLAELSMHRRQHIVVIRSGESGLVAHTMFFASEIRKDQEYRADANELKPRELDLAKRLIESMAVPFEPEKFHDTYRERVQQLIDAKVAGKQVAREHATAPQAAQVVDIFEALQKSLNAIKKPAAQAPPAPSKRRARKAG